MARASRAFTPLIADCRSLIADFDPEKARKVADWLDHYIAETAASISTTR